MSFGDRVKRTIRAGARRAVGPESVSRADVDALASENAALRSDLEATRAELSAAVRDVAALRARVARLESLASAPPAVTTGEAAAERPPALRPVPSNDADGMAFDLLYSAFEEEMRGSREQVRELALPHVPTVESFGAHGLPVLDVGCGRGEFLELLGEVGIPARGIELNPVSVAECLERGLDVVEGDGIAYLESLEENSLRGVVSFHVVEHLTPGQRARFLRAAHRAIAPGGGCILEAPNPENLRVGAAFFWLDPTHLRPIPPRLLVFEARAAGFEQVDILGLAPAGDYLVAPEGTDAFVVDVAERVNSLVSGPMHFAIVARKFA